MTEELLDEIRIYRPSPRLDQNAPVILTVIANWPDGDRVLAFAAMHRVDFSFINQGRGTVRKVWVREDGVSDLRKEIVTIATDRSNAYAILEELKVEMHLEADHSGIAFLRRAVDHAADNGHLVEKEKKAMDSVEFRAIYVVVDKGFAEDVILVGERAGTRGATILPGRGDARTGQIPGMTISNDKELLLIITSKEKSLKFLETVRADETVMTKGKGKVFVMEILDTVGINFY